MKSRLQALDGLRGLAILAVFINHVPLVILYSSLPLSLHYLLQVFIGSGGVGVFIFFILSGFLMGLLYPKPKSKIAFLSKRYARLFPPFLVMVTAVTIIKLLGKLPFITELLIVILCAVIARIIWQICLLISSKYKVGKWIFLSFLGFQIMVGLWYWLYLLKVPSAVFYQIWSKNIQTIITGIINATLTLPFGNYIAQLDGVYWTLNSEILFYIFYPLFIIPFIWEINKRSRVIDKTLLYLTLIPFCFGIYLISQRILGFEILKFHLVFYFITGVIIGMNFSVIKKILSPFLKLLSHPFMFILIILVVFGHQLILMLFPKNLTPFIDILTVFPVGLLIIISILENTFSAIFLANPILTFFGKYSYSLYLTHSFVINHIKKYIEPSTIISAGLLTIVSLISATILSIILYNLIEKPYFDLGKNRSKVKSKDYSKSSASKLTFTYPTPLKSVIIFTLGMFVLLYAAYKSPLAFFTTSFRHQANRQQVVLTEVPYRIYFNGTYDNLGMVTSHIKNQKVESVSGGFVPSKLFIRLLDSDKNLVAENSFNAYEIIDSRFHPLGFPLQTDSKGKRYTIEYQLDKVSQSTDILLINNEGYLSVYFEDKSDLLNSPLNLVKWLFLKISEPFTNPYYWFTFLFIYPFLFILVWNLFPRRH